jgi:glycosyltransferase involved in cell wall biosynthesis
VTNETQPRLSLVVPAFNEEARIGSSLERIGAYLDGIGYASEVIVVDDGSREPGLRAAEASLQRLPASVPGSFLRHEVNRGKGAAVRTGCLAARGQYVAFIDADLASPPEDLPALLAALDAGADVAIGVRNQDDGSDMRSQRSLPRKLAGQLYTFVMRTLLLPDIGDSQCPLKAFKRPAAQRLFRLQRIDTWAFDAELLFLASRLGLRVEKTPVRWQAMEGSHLKLNLKSAMELWNLLRIRWAHRGVSRTTLAGELPAASS